MPASCLRPSEIKKGLHQLSDCKMNPFMSIVNNSLGMPWPGDRRDGFIDESEAIVERSSFP